MASKKPSKKTKAATRARKNTITKRSRGNEALRLLNEELEARVKQRTRAFRESEDRFRRLAETIEEVFWMADPEIKKIVYVSPGYERIWGRSLESLYDDPRSFIEAIHPQDRERALTELEAQKIGQPFDHEYRIIRPDGSIRWIWDRGFPVRSKTGSASLYAGVATDVTERKRAQEALQWTHSRLELALAASRVCTWDFDLVRGAVALSDSWAETVGGPPGVTRTTFQELLRLGHPDDVASFRHDFIEVLKGLRTEYAVEHRVRHASGEWRWIISRGKVVERDAQGRAVRMVGTNLDISERKRNEERLLESERRLSTLFANLPGMAYSCKNDPHWTMTLVSEGCEAVTGYKHGELENSGTVAYGDLIHPEDRDLLWARCQASLDLHKPCSNEYRIIAKSGEVRWVWERAEGVYADDGTLLSIEGFVQDITERKRAEARLVQLAQFDQLTGLPNRNLLEERLQQVIAQARRHGRCAGVMFVDIDHFKLVNDTFGHPFGDELLAEVGKRLKDCVRPDDVVGRLGGDEFAVVIADLASVEDAAIVAQKIIDRFSLLFEQHGQETFVTLSIGIAVFPGDGDNASDLLKCADTAMYRVKESSRNGFRFFAAEMNTRTALKLHLHTDLRHAIDRQEFQLHYQPKVELSSRAVIGIEALLRWRHPQRGMIFPTEFIPALEDTGLIVPVGDWVFEEVRRQMGVWLSNGLKLVPVAVNLSAKQFRRRNLDQLICDLLAEEGISPQLLELEITESCLIDDPREAVRQLQALREAGLAISVDDFGTGYSSLSYLTRLPISTLKIDRGFVNAAIADPASATIVKMVIDMSQSLRLNVVAEGIETEEQVAFLRSHGCNQGQGYLFGKPMPGAAIAERLQRLS